MTRTRRLLSGIGVDYLTKVVILVCGLWLTRFLLRELDQEYGRWLVILQYLALADLLELGVTALVPRETAYITGQTTAEALPAALTLFVREVMALLYRLLPIVVTGAAVFWFVVSGPNDPQALPLAVVAVAFVVSFPFRVFLPLVQGLQDLAFMGLATTVAWFLQAGLSVGLVWAGLGFWALVAGWIASRFWLYGICWWRARAKFQLRINDDATPAAPGEHRALLRRGLWVSLGSLSQVLLSGADLIVLGKLMGHDVVVVYVCTGKLVTILTTQAYGVVLAAQPALSELRFSAFAERVLPVAKALSLVMLLTSGFIACNVLMINESFVTWWVGSDQYAGTAVTLLMVANMLTRHLAFTFVNMLFCFGHERGLAVISLVDGLTTVGGSILLIWIFGLIGPVLASLAGVCLITLPTTLYLLARETSVPIGSILSGFVPWFWRLACLGTLLLVLHHHWVPGGLLSMSAATAGVSVVYVVVMLPVIRRSPLWQYLLPQLVRLRNSLGANPH